MEALPPPSASANLSVEVQQYIYRTAFHTYNRKQTESRSKRYLDILHAHAVQANDSFDKTDAVDYVRAVQEARGRAEARRRENLRNPFYQVDPSQLYEGDEHTNKFVEHCIDKYIIYAGAEATTADSGKSKRTLSSRGSGGESHRGKSGSSSSSTETTAHAKRIRDATSTMSRADKLALRILQLTDSLYSSLLLRRCFIKYGISSLSKLRIKGLQTEHLGGGKDGHMDDETLDTLLETPSLLNELANEAVICAEDIEHRILQEQDKMVGTQMAAADELRWTKTPPSIHDDFYDDYVMKRVQPDEDVPSNSTSTVKKLTNRPCIMYAKCRNHLMETTLHDPSYEDGFSAYLRDIVHEMLTSTKIRYCGRYSKKNKEKGVFWGYSFQDKVHDTDLIAPLYVRSDEASIFGHRKKCDSECGHHRFTEREWLYYYREAKEKAGAAPRAKKKKEKAKAKAAAKAAKAAAKAAAPSKAAPEAEVAQDKGLTKVNTAAHSSGSMVGSLGSMRDHLAGGLAGTPSTGANAIAKNRFKGLRGRRVYCPDCAKKNQCNSFALQSGLMIRGQFEHALKLVRAKLLELSTKGMAHVGSLPSELRTDVFSARDGTSAHSLLEIADRQRIMSGAVFAAAQANVKLQEMLANCASEEAIETVRREALHLARVADEERNRIMAAKEEEEERERMAGASCKSSGSYYDMEPGALAGAQLQISTDVGKARAGLKRGKKNKWKPTTSSWRPGKSTLSSPSSSYPSSISLTSSSSSAAAEEAAAAKLNHEALMMLANSHIKEDMEKLSAADYCLEISHVELGMQGKLDFETICKVPQDATYVFAGTDEQAAAEMGGGGGDENDSLIGESGDGNTTGKVVTLPSARARNLLINDSRRGNRRGKTNREGVKMLRKAFWAVQKCRTDHFGKDQSHRNWPQELYRVVSQDEDPLERAHPRHSTVMWRLRDGFEKYQEHCHRRKGAIVDVSPPDETGGFPRADNNKLHRMTRRYFDMYFGHLFTMSNKRDWTPMLHIRYMEIMVEALQRTQDSIMTELACLELWKEVSRDKNAVWGAGIARLGHALMGRIVRESEGVEELCNADVDGNGRMTGDEFIDFNCKRLISHLGEAQWGRVPGMLGLCAQRLRCATARNVPAFPIDSMIRARRHIEAVDTALEDLLEGENAFEAELSAIYAKFDTSVGVWTEEEVAKKRLALAKQCEKHGINSSNSRRAQDELFHELAQRELIYRGAQRRLRMES